LDIIYDRKSGDVYYRCLLASSSSAAVLVMKSAGRIARAVGGISRSAARLIQVSDGVLQEPKALFRLLSGEDVRRPACALTLACSFTVSMTYRSRAGCFARTLADTGCKAGCYSLLCWLISGCSR